MSAPIIHTDGNAIVLDLSTGASLCGCRIAGLDASALGELIACEMQRAGTAFAFGRWSEPRELYRSAQFASADEAATRTIHMGIDLFCAAGTPVHAPLDGVVEHAANNAQELDYGPLVILRHRSPSGADFFTLYGHLSLDTLTRLRAGQRVSAGEIIAAVGAPPSNGNWPPHLHFQRINDLIKLGTDFPGVTSRRDREYWLALSPSPANFFPEVDAGALEYASCN